MLSAEAILRLVNHPMITVPENMTIIDALKSIVDNKCGAVCVERQGQVVGLWTERDLMRNMISGPFDMQTALIGDYMVTNLYTVPHTASLEELEDKCVGLYIRHLFVEKDGQIIGLLTARDLLVADLNLKSDEVKNLKSYVSLEYYENWRWKKP
ncbi:MAG: CBS domain-containing protein [Proteobacteria bacterium]|nr:CBS domain-containing protein [Pseudomonadota bacterium]